MLNDNREVRVTAGKLKRYDLKNKSMIHNDMGKTNGNQYGMVKHP